MTTYRTATVDGLDVFYREAGPPDAPTIVLLHGFPSSSHQFRWLIDRLADRWHLVAPDYPGFGYSSSPPADEFAYTFDRLAEITERFLGRLGIERFAPYVFDFGAPIGFRIAARNPEKIAALIVQNGNAYEQGLGPVFDPARGYWRDRAGFEPKMRELLTLEATRSQYTTGARHPERLSPDAWTLDQHFLDQPGRDQIMLDLFYDYQSNVALYPAWHAYFREHRPPTLIVWGKNDQIFTVAGAEAYTTDLPEAELHLLDTGHFALEEEVDTIAERIDAFLGGRLRKEA